MRRLQHSAPFLLVATLLLASAAGAGDATPPAADVVDRVAQAYYAVPRGERRESTGVLSGIVVDRRGRAIAGARLVVKKPASLRVIGESTTDDAGRFRIPRVPKRVNVVTVTADGFVRWSVESRIAAEGVTIPLDREVDDVFLSSLPAVADPEERLWGVLELVGARQFGLTLRDVHPYIGGLRPDLRLIASSPAFARADDRGTPADRARRLLTWWADPADADLTASWLAAHDSLRPPPTKLRSPFVDGLCSVWADVHFEDEEIPARGRTAHGCFERRLSKDGSRAHLTFWVRYAHWGYEMELVAINKGEWELVLIGDGVIDHFEH